MLHLGNAATVFCIATKIVFGIIHVHFILLFMYSSTFFSCAGHHAQIINLAYLQALYFLISFLLFIRRLTPLVYLSVFIRFFRCRD